MKRTALKPSTYELPRKPIRRRSKSTAAVYRRERIPFVKAFIKANPWCKVKWEGCTIWTQDVHEWWSRGTGGAILPGPKADIQGQRFIPVCRHCHGELDLQPERAKEKGWVRRVGNRSQVER